MSNSIRKALMDAGRIEITIQGKHSGEIEFCVHENAFRLDGLKRGKFTKAELDAAADSDGMIREVISEAFRKNHISYEAREESGADK